jgi:hypothetical protein
MKLLITEKIYALIEEAFTNNTEKQKVYSFLQTILSKTMLEAERKEYMPMHSGILRIDYGGFYLKWLNSLKDLDVVQVKAKLNAVGEVREEYEVGATSKSYRVNPDMLTGDLKVVAYENKRRRRHENRVIIKGLNYTDEVLEDLRSLKLDKTALLCATDEHIDGIRRKSFSVDEEISKKSVQLLNDPHFFKGHRSRENAIKLAHQRGLQLIQDKKKYFIADVESYVQTKRSYTRDSYQYSIESLCAGVLYARRAHTNNRLHHNLTELPKPLLHVIKLANDLVEIDMRNSQYALLAYALQEDNVNTEDALSFRQHAGDGNLYEYMMQVFGTSRAEVKEMMMQVCFSKDKATSPEKKLFRTHFPTVAKYVSDVKKAKGYKQVAINLQLIESGLFIDTLYPQIKGKFGFSIPKHDSFIVRRREADGILADIQEITDGADFKCKFKIGDS